ncbi:MAG: hypothetical protein ACJ8C4_14735 [Gemmataceae bacterium]
MTYFVLLAISATYLPKAEEQFCYACVALQHGDYPTAIVNFRGTLIRQPWHVKGSEGMALARAQVAIPSGLNAELLRPEETWYPGWLLHPLMFVICFFAYLAFCFAIAAWALSRRARWLRISCLLAIPTLITFTSLFVQRERMEHELKAPFVVMLIETPLRSGNGIEYPEIIRLPRGTEARRLIQRGDWTQLELASGVQGWVFQSLSPHTVISTYAP